MPALFLLLLFITFSIALIVTRTGSDEKRTRERMDLLVKLQGQAENKELHLEKLQPPSFTDRLTERFRNYGFAHRLEKKLLHAGWEISVGKFLLLAGASGVGAAAVLCYFAGANLPMIGLGLVVGIAANFGLLRWKASQRLKKFNEALPDSIELMARALRAGHSVASAIEVVAQQSPSPIGPEFSKCAQQQRFGIPFRDVMLTLSEQLPSQDLKFLVTAILVQKETGGDLTEILDRTTRVIRERVRIQGEIRTKTAQGRLTGVILSALPMVLLGGTSIISPSYSHVLFYDPLGHKLLYAAAGLIVLGAFTIQRIVDIKV